MGGQLSSSNCALGAREESLQMGGQLSSSNCALGAREESQQMTAEDERIVTYSLKVAGSRGISREVLHSEIHYRYYPQLPASKISLPQITAILQNLERQNRARQESFQGQVRWFSNEVEMTSIEEVHAMEYYFNNVIQRSQGKPEELFSAKACSERKFMGVRLEEYNKEVRINDFEVDAASSHNEGSASSSPPRDQLCSRSVCLVKFTVQTDLGDWVIEARSKPCIGEDQARVIAHHMILQNISQDRDNRFSDTVKSRCHRKFLLGYNRGLELIRFGMYPFKEDMFMELKGGEDKKADIWDYKNFDETFMKVAPKNIAAFINRMVFDRHTPALCRIVFGVHDDGQIQGIGFPKDSIMIEHSSIQVSLQSKLRQKLTSVLEYNCEGSVISDFVHVDCQSITCAKGETTRCIVVTVSLVFPSDFIPRPVLLRATEKYCFYFRESKPETINLPLSAASLKIITLSKEKDDQIVKELVGGVDTLEIVTEQHIAMIKEARREKHQQDRVSGLQGNKKRSAEE